MSVTQPIRTPAMTTSAPSLRLPTFEKSALISYSRPANALALPIRTLK